MNEKAARSDAEKWRDIAADLMRRIDAMHSPTLFRFRGERDGEVFERDVVRFHSSEFDDILEERPYLKGWLRAVDGELIVMLSPSDVVAAVP